ncbi:MAG TPA: 50S ribosomal protein L25 [Gemmatimonadaceae bacterium]|jgi:large subunit ribosomal protein L25|nr:50S ribosomal protein L25 [Gemmatimonadaceae bacterium]
MAIATLSATPRVDTGKGVARSLRREGQIPGVIYGHARTPQPLAIPARELEKLLSHISADNTLIELSLGGTSARALIREIQRHPFKRNILHVDFQEVVAGEKVTVRIPIALTGTPVGVRLNGGIVDHIMRELTISVDPANIPTRIEIDVTELDLGQSIHVSQVPVPAGAIVMDEAEAAVVVIATPRAAIEATAAEGEPTSAEPEVIRAKKPEEGADEKGDKK